MASKLFEYSLLRVFPQTLPKRIAVALSGGVDSMCLTHLLQSYVRSKRLDTEIFPINIDHQLRTTSSLETPIIGREISKLGLENNFLTKQINLPQSSAIENVARIERYRALTELCQKNGIDHIMTAHHYNDQLETFLLRLFGNSGVFGLSGMQVMSKSPINVSPQRLNVVRPMLEIEKSQIYQYCLDNGINWVQDHTNFEEINKRNVIRKYLSEHSNVENDVKGQFEMTKTFVSANDSLVSELYDDLNGKGKIVQDGMKLQVSLTPKQFKASSRLVLPRLLFKLAYPLSPSTNYHYSFQKLLGKFENILPNEEFSLLQLQWTMATTEDEIVITATRQNLKDPIVETFTVLPKTKTDWFLFDNRFWFRFTNDSDSIKSYTLKTLSKNDKNLFHDLPDDYKYTNYANQPALIDNETQKIIALPTVNPYEGVEWQLKDNIYNL